MRGEKETLDGVGEAEVAAVLDHGPAEGHSAICHIGRGLAAYSASAEDLDEDLAEDGGAVTHTCARVFLGFQDGGGQIQRMAQDAGIHT